MKNYGSSSASVSETCYDDRCRSAALSPCIRMNATKVMVKNTIIMTMGIYRHKS